MGNEDGAPWLLACALRAMLPAMMRRFAWLSVTFASIFAAGCGGKVAVDAPSAGSGGSTTTSTVTTTITTTTTMTTTTTTTTTTTVTGPCGGSVFTGVADCESCVESSCCAELSACAPGTPCGNLLACQSTCPNGEGGCLGNCQMTFPAGQADYQALDGCFQNNCIEDPSCNGPICDSGAQAFSPLCGDCLGAFCCDIIKACLADSQCIDCLAMDPGAPGCQTNGTLQKTLGCIEQTCSLACQ